MWYGRFLLYQRDKNGKEVRKQRNVPICPKAGVPKTRAAQMLQQIILKEGTVPGKPSALPPDDSVTFEWFTRQRYVPMRQGKWSPAYRQTNGYAIEHYLISRFGYAPLRDLDTFSIQVYLTSLPKNTASRWSIRLTAMCGPSCALLGSRSIWWKTPPRTWFCR
jgi:hypothetical protein